MAVLLSAQDLSKSFGTRVLFEGLTFGIHEGERIGLIGPNGAGKSTLLKILAGVEEYDDGDLSSKRQLRMGYVPQEDSFDPEATPWHLLEMAIADEHLGEREQAMRINSVLGRIGFDQDQRHARVGSFSGGWRKRTAIAREVARQPELLLMDEPTNHLDLESILWLEKFLADANFGCLLISHDRYFLEHTVNRTIELSPKYPGGYYSSSGNYSDFLLKREEFLEGQLKTQHALASQVRREAEWLKRGPPARTTKQRARIDEAGRLMDELAAVKNRNSQGGAVKIDFVSTDRQSNKLLALKNVGKSMGGRALIENLTMMLSPGMKLGLLGANGSGKSTFLKLLAGEWEPDSGTIERADRLRVVYFDQSREQLDKEAPLRRALAPSGDTVTFRDQPMHVSAWAKRFLFQNEQLDLPVKNLSGGEQARILIARLMLRPADLLLLDEPTNDLDIPSLEVLEESLKDFPGALVLVTHDRFMLENLSTDLLGLDGKGGAQLFSDFTQWQNAQVAAREVEAEVKKAAAPSAKTAEKSAPKNTKRLTYKEQLEWDGMEAAILAGEAEVHAVQVKLDAPDAAADPKKLMDLCHDLADAQAKVEGLYARWAELEEKQK